MNGRDDELAPRAAGRLAWMSPSLVSAAVVAAASGMGQFAITAVIGDVAQAFGTPDAGSDLSSRIGLQATTLGIALAIIRLASLGSLLGSALADHVGRRRVLLLAITVGLVLTGASGLAPSFWTWVALVAVARPWLSTINAVAGVVAAEEVTARYRSWAIGLVAATYGLGSGIISIGRSLLPEGFRPVMFAVLLPVLALPWLYRSLVEPSVALRAHLAETGPALPGAVPARHLPDLVRLVAIAGGIAVATGPGFTYVFVYGESILGLSRATMAVVVLAAGPVGLVGLLAGRWLADHVGRRPGIAVGLVGTAAGFAGTYSGSVPLMFAGYLVGILAGGAIGPGLGSAGAEVFPTEVRATVAGWLAAAGVIGAVVGLATFGALADATGGFAGAAAILALVPVVAALALWRLPETVGWELDGRPPVPGPVGAPPDLDDAGSSDDPDGPGGPRARDHRDDRTSEGPDDPAGPGPVGGGGLVTGRRPVVTVYTRDGCGLCATAERLARREARRAHVEYVDVDGDPELQRRYNIRVPVVAIDGVEIAELVVEPGTIRAAVHRARRARRDGRR